MWVCIKHCTPFSLKFPNQKQSLFKTLAVSLPPSSPLQCPPIKAEPAARDGVAAGRQWRVHAHPGGRRGRQAPASRRGAGVRGLPERPAVARRPLVGPGRRARGPPRRRGRGRPRLPRPARHQQGALALSSHLLSRSVSGSRSAAEFSVPTDFMCQMGFPGRGCRC
jgi:hypothetical protein